MTERAPTTPPEVAATTPEPSAPSDNGASAPADNGASAPSERPHPVDVPATSTGGGDGSGAGQGGSRGGGGGIGIGTIIGAIGGVIIRGGVVGGDRCDPRGRRPRSGGGYPLPGPMPRGPIFRGY